MYLPRTKYRVFTATAQDSLAGPDGVLYQGPYFETFTGEKFTGNIPSRNSKPLTDILSPDQSNNLSFSIPLEVTDYDSIRNDKKELQLRSTSPIPPYYPKPMPADYKSKTLLRYFAVDKSTGRTLEISKQVFTSLRSKEVKYYYPKYTTKVIKWSLVNINANEQTIYKEGIGSYLKDPSQFVR